MESDQFEQRLLETTAKLKECQEQMGVKSCFECEKLFECEIRSDYVEAVYKSLNKGVEGGFEF